MNANLIDGRHIANHLLTTLQHKVKFLQQNHNISPGIAVLLIGNNPASELYVNNKIKVANQIGINNFLFRLPSDSIEKNIITKIETLNNDPKVHGILVQLPLPENLNTYNIINAINPAKDVDGFHSINIGKLVTNHEGLVAATARGCLKLIKSVKSDLSGLKAVVIGRSNIVGKPVAHLLLNEDCTVTIIHSKSNHIDSEISNADIIVVAIGSPKFLGKDLVKKDAIIIDVGINRDEISNEIIGDVDFIEVSKLASYITPVPGGVGPMTIACLLENTVIAACSGKNIDYKSL